MIAKRVGAMGHPTARPGDDLVRPMVLVALVVLLVNDHVLKSAAPGLITGKLSDAAGLFAAPFVVRAIVEIALARRQPWVGHSRVPLAASAVVVATGFAAIKLVPDAAWLFGSILAWAQWLPGALGAAGSSAVVSPLVTTGPGGPAAVVLDPTDLLMLPAAALAVVLAGQGGAGRRSSA